MANESIIKNRINYLMTDYYKVCAVVQLIWQIAVLAFTVVMFLLLKTPFVLFALGLLFMRPFVNLNARKVVYDDKQADKIEEG